MIAANRIDHDHWNNGRALEEAHADGMSFFQLPRKGFIWNFHSQAIEANGALKSDGAALPAATTRAVALPVAPAVH